MLKWLVLGIVVALVSHWSSKEVHADTPLSEDEENLLRQLRSEIDMTPDIDERNQSSEDLCEAQCEGADDDACLAECLLLTRTGSDDFPSCDDCQSLDTEDQDDCETACADAKRMLLQVRSQEERQEGMLDNESHISKKIFRRRRGRRWIRIRRFRFRVPKAIAVAKAMGWITGKK